MSHWGLVGQNATPVFKPFRAGSTKEKIASEIVTSTPFTLLAKDTISTP
jgi:hypothetical protein